MTSLQCLFGALLMLLINARGAELSLPKLGSTNMKPGAVYALDASGAWLVSDPLKNFSADGVNEWFSNERMNHPNGSTDALSKIAPTVTRLGERISIDFADGAFLSGHISRIRRLNGEADFPVIFNRKLMGLISERSPELRITQMRLELSSSLKLAGMKNYPVALCVEQLWMTNLIMRISDAEKDRIKRPGQVTAWADRYGLICRGVDIRVGSVTYDFAGELLFQSEFREISEGLPSSGLESNFFMGRRILLQCPFPF